MHKQRSTAATEDLLVDTGSNMAMVQVFRAISAILTVPCAILFSTQNDEFLGESRKLFEARIERSFFHSSPEKVEYVQDKAGDGSVKSKQQFLETRAGKYSEPIWFQNADSQVALPLPKKLHFGCF